MDRARTSIEGTTCPLQGYPGTVALVDNGDGGVREDFPKPGEGSDKGRVMLDR